MAVNDYYVCRTQEGIYAGRFAPSALTTLIDSMAPNTFAQLNTTNIRDGVLYEYFDEVLAALETDTTRIMTNWTNKYAFVQSKQRIVGVGTSEGYAGSADGRFRSKCLTFELSTNQFNQAWNPTGRVEGHGYDANCSVDMNGKLYRKGINSAVVSEYDINTQLWSDKFTITGFGSLLDVWAIEVFPDLGAQGSVMCLEKFGRLFRFDIATSTLSLIGTYTGIATNPVMIYVNGAVVFGAGNASGAYVGDRLYRIESSGSTSILSDALPLIITANSNSKILPCPSGRDAAFVFNNDDDLVRELNTISGQFSTVGAYQAELGGSVYVAGISITGTKGIVLLRGRGRTGGVNQSEFWVYRIPA